jgi:hypothetical protein
MPKVGTAWVEVRGRRNKLKTDMDLAERLVKNSASKMQGILNRISFQGLALGAAAMGAAVTYALNGAVTAASNLEEATSKFGVVFGDQAGLAEKWSKELVDGYAMSTRESREFLSSVQDLLVPMGMAADAAGRMSFDITKLAADLGSFNNKRTSDVMNDIQSALVGNYETMKKYGVVLSAAVVEQEALRSGLAKTKGELTAIDKAQAAYNLVVRGSTAAIGDMERTADGYANTTKKLNAAWENFSATLGEKFIVSAGLAKSAMTGLLNAATAAMQGTSIEMQLMALEAEHNYLLNYQENKAKERQAFQAKAAERMRKFEEDQMREYSTALGQGGGLFDSPMREPVPVKTDIELRLESIGRQMDALREKWVDDLLLDAFDLSSVSVSTATPLADSTAADLKKVDALLGQYFGSIDREGRELSAEIERFWTDWNAHIIAEATKTDQEMADAFEATRTALVDMRLTDFFGDLDAEAKKLNKLRDISVKNAEDMKNAFMGWGNQFSAMLTDAVWDADFSFNRILESFGRMITQMVIQKQIVEPMVNFAFTKNAQGNAYGPDGLIPFAKGGVVSRPTLFPFAKGTGLMGEAGPEAIMPLHRTASGDLGVKAAGSGVVNNIYVSGGQGTPKVSEQQNSTGGMDIEVVFDQMMSSKLAQRGSQSNRALRNTYGAREGLISR